MKAVLLPEYLNNSAFLYSSPLVLYVRVSTEYFKDLIFQLHPSCVRLEVFGRKKRGSRPPIHALL